MKGVILFIMFVALMSTTAFAQNVGQRVKNRATDDANYKIDNKVDNAVDKADEAIGNIFKKKHKKRNKKENSADSPNQSNNSQQNKTVASSPILPDTSSSDFKPGKSVIFHDDFSKDALADFPAKWNSTGSGKVATLNGAEGRWLEVAASTLVTPYMEKALPENCTIEFDLFLNSPQGSMVPFIQFGFSDSRNILTQDVYRSQRFWISLDNYDSRDLHVLNYGLNDRSPLGDKQSFPLTDYANKILHVSIAINKTRVRVYFGETKIIDLPRVLTPAMLHTFYIANYPKIPASTAGLFIGNVRIASADVDARSLLVKQLMEEGKAVTNDILFDVNSDVIKPASYSIINQLGDALKSNASLRIKIIGHTDSDGSTENNLILSKRRADAVKNYLLYKYGIAANRLQTDGKGESQPVTSNNTEAGKAKNRRVEFIKL